MISYGTAVYNKCTQTVHQNIYNTYQNIYTISKYQPAGLAGPARSGDAPPPDPVRSAEPRCRTNWVEDCGAQQPQQQRPSSRAGPDPVQIIELNKKNIKQNRLVLAV